MVHQHTARSKVDTFLVNIDSNSVTICNLYGQVSIADSAPSGVNRQAIDNEDKKVKDCLSIDTPRCIAHIILCTE